ncbi:hypothetical protein NQ176_g6749 [Zarea fungicola]|uniref:Uncharacterized protein n=1 Tax=Zarea fungicola TaxID=93591 RepID=A0ACC1N1N0_9HYPO|nr:hypothetical protein NQ176_g6749 [Lecanicillium fungicola]
MWSQIAVVSSVLMAARPAAASYIPESPDSTQPTQVAIASDHLIGISPRVTDSPLLDPASLQGRADALGRNSDTCGFYSDGYPLRCYTSTATCIYGASFGGCCNVGTTCSSVYTACIGYSDVLKGSCNPTLVTDPKVACW